MMIAEPPPVKTNPDMRSPDNTKEKKHPKGLWVLFGTEMWERFNFYGMRALLALFLVTALQFKEEDATIIYGGFLGLCYLTPMLGGFISDRFLGNRNCILLGGLMMACGQLTLFSSASILETNLELAQTLTWCALGLIILGNGFFKPNISSMVGYLYPKSQKSKLDTAFTIFYLGINLGAFLGMSICPLLGDVTKNGIRNLSAFRWGFLAASVAMLIGTTIFYVLKNKYIVTPEGKPIGGPPSQNEAADFEKGEATTATFSNTSLVFAVGLFLALGCLFYFVFEQNIIYALIYSSGITLANLILTDASLTKIEKDRVLVIYIISFFVIFFWAAFEQAGSSLTFLANNQTNRNFLGQEIPPSMVQLCTGLFVLILSIPVSLLWNYLNSNKREPTSPFKQAIGLTLIALAYFIIANNVKDLGTDGLLAVKWLIFFYMIQAAAELCLSPIGLSLVGKLSPKRFSSLLYGVFFLSNASGYALGGTMGSLMPATSDKFKKAEELGINLQDVLDKKIVPSATELSLLDTHHIPTEYPVFVGFTIHSIFEFFIMFVIMCSVAAFLLFALTPRLKKMMHGIR
jgi:POT family proton-dependent oligopeptide transporter